MERPQFDCAGPYRVAALRATIRRPCSRRLSVAPYRIRGVARAGPRLVLPYKSRDPDCSSGDRQDVEGGGEGEGASFGIVVR
ncbi:hypothetical protein NRB56_37410 [Nocardia sp. RB56]|uniref:Uncharacterized protein n=1 Tax=Nocardia aurantia TaxID=2585199 RepID=A0A7K0DRD0_9NOCA|nr:hypothetical protein [Nocardia aurantia]